MGASSIERWPVAIVGAGPVGLSLALGLARQGVRSLVVERDPSTSERSKAPGIHVRTREVFRQWGVERRFVEAGTLVPELRVHSSRGRARPFAVIDFAALAREADRPGVLVLEQARTEALLLEELRASGMAEVCFGAEAVALSQRDGGAHLEVRADGRTQAVEASFVVGCDGASSFVRGALDLPFDGSTYAAKPALADVRVEDARDELPWPRVSNSREALTVGIRLSPGTWRIIRLERAGDHCGDTVPPGDAAAWADEVLGRGPVEMLWGNWFRIHRRASPRFRVGRVLLAGDAAHLHSPVGGQGMNSGIQDAHNLAWKLAYALRGGDVDRLLDSYVVERRDVVVGSVTRTTHALTRILVQTPAPIRAVVFATLSAALAIPGIRRRGLRRVAMLDLHYGGSPLLDRRERSAGRRLPNPVLQGPGGEETRLYDLLGEDPAFIEIADAPGGGALPLRRVVRIGREAYRDPSGTLRSLLRGDEGIILVRPDRHVAWARENREGIEAATRRALGAADEDAVSDALAALVGRAPGADRNLPPAR